MNRDVVSEIVRRLSNAYTELAVQMKKGLQAKNNKELDQVKAASAKIYEEVTAYLVTVQNELDQLVNTPEFKHVDQVTNDLPPRETAKAKDVTAWHKKVMQAFEALADKHGNGLKKAA